MTTEKTTAADRLRRLETMMLIRAYEQQLQTLIQQSTFQKAEKNLDVKSVNMEDSFNK